MIKISEAIERVVSSNPFFEFGLSEKLFNLTKLAGFITQSVALEAKKSVTTSAILVNLSRIQQRKHKVSQHFKGFEMENITMQMQLGMFSFYKTDNNAREIEELREALDKRRAQYAVLEGFNEYTLMVEERLVDLVHERMTVEPKYKKEGLSALSIKFPKRYIEVPGFLCFVTQLLAFQNINIYGSLSTYSEYTLYVQQSQLALALDVLQQSLGKK